MRVTKGYWNIEQRPRSWVKKSQKRHCELCLLQNGNGLLWSCEVHGQVHCQHTERGTAKAHLESKLGHVARPANCNQLDGSITHLYLFCGAQWKALWHSDASHEQTTRLVGCERSIATITGNKAWEDAKTHQVKISIWSSIPNEQYQLDSWRPATKLQPNDYLPGNACEDGTWNSPFGHVMYKKKNSFKFWFFEARNLADWLSACKLNQANNRNSGKIGRWRERNHVLVNTKSAIHGDTTSIVVLD